MKTNIFITLFLMISLCLCGQTGNVGVRTTAPRTTLDVNGTINVNNEINIGGNDTTIGNPGTVGDLFAGRADTIAVWRKYDLPAGYLDGLILSATYTRSSVAGVTFPGSGTATSTAYDENELITARSWVTIDGVQVASVKVTKPVNKVNISIQTVAQITGASGVGSFGCGIFVDGQLKFVRTNNVAGTSGSYRILNFNASLNNLSTTATNLIQFACVRRNVPATNTLTIGINQAGSTALNPALAGTSLSVQVLESIQ